MKFWLCDSCGKKVAEMLKACPYCKTSKQGLKSEPSDNSKYLKMVIALLVTVIIAGGAYFVFNSSEAISAKPLSNSQAQSEQPTNKRVVPKMALDAFDAFKKFEARTEVGINYKDFSPALSEAKYPLNLFIESTASKEVPELVTILNSVYETYKMVGELWDDKFSESNGRGKYDFADRKRHPKILEKYPELIADQYGSAEYLYTDRCIPFLFVKAGEELKKASAMIMR